VKTAILVAAITGAVAVAGWFVNGILSGRANRRQAMLKDQLDRRQALLGEQIAHVQRQLAELYGPLAFLLHEGEATFQDLLDTLGRRPGQYIFPAHGQLPDEELKVWLFWVDNDLMPRNSAIQKLLSAKTHLLVDGDLPASYLAFLNHFNSWRVSHERWKQEGVPYSWHSKVNWPKAFREEVLATFRTLMQQHARLLSEVSVAATSLGCQLSGDVYGTEATIAGSSRRQHS